jgi:hypothetical protein
MKCLEYTSERIYTLSKNITVFRVILISSEDINKGIYKLAKSYFLNCKTKQKRTKVLYHRDPSHCAVLSDQIS